MLVKFLFNDYENFKFTNSLIGQVYTSTPEGPDAEDAVSEKDSKRRLVETLTTKSTKYYNYYEFMFAWLLQKLFCCFQRASCYKYRIQRYQCFIDSRMRLQKELSLHHLLSTMRLTDFIAQLMCIENYQKLLINKSRKY